MESIDHRSVAIATYNRSQELLYAQRTSEEDIELLTCAFASRYHWQQIGGPQQKSVADWAVSRAAVAVGETALGLEYAIRAANAVEIQFPSWLRASLLEGVARAYNAMGEIERRDEFIARARAELKLEKDREDAAIIESQINELL